MIRRPPRSTLFPTRRSSDLRNAVSTSSRLTSISIGPLPARRSGPLGPSVAPITLTSKEITSTPAGGSSLIVKLNGAVVAPPPPPGRLLLLLPPHPATRANTNRPTQTNKRFRCMPHPPKRQL